MAPVLPNKLLDQIDQPFPILVGMTRKDFDNIDSIFEEDINSSFDAGDYMQTDEFLGRTWIFLDCEHQQISWGNSKDVIDGVMDWCSDFAKETQKDFV